MTPEQPNKAGLFPRFGSKYRYTGPTMAESRSNTLSRDQPRFDRTLSGRGLPTRSMDGEFFILIYSVLFRILLASLLTRF